ncbi:MAG: EAL domain-containing protein [Methylomarinum sp.]|nr:EAL domain-containing protein [Methylomarinum sp.]
MDNIVSALSQKNRTSLRKLLIICCISVAYALFGFIGDLFTDQASDATAIWPASGIALASCLIWGRSACFGVFIGAFIINAWLGFDLTSNQSIFRSTLLVSIISFGAALQALAGHFLVIKFSGQDSLFQSSAEILQLLFFGGIFSCLINSTMGVSSLVFVGVIPFEQYLTSWLVWWLGDSMGVIIFAPLTLIFFAKPREHWQPKLYSVAIPLFVALILVVVIFTYAREQEKKQQTVQFEQDAFNMHNDIKTKFKQYYDTLYVLKSFLEHADVVTRTEFSTFTNRILLQQKEIRALLWIRYFSDSERQQFEQNIKNEDFDEFRIFDKDNRLNSSLSEDKYAVVTYIEPFESNKDMFGLNILSDKKIADTLLEAASAKKEAVTPRVELIQVQQNRLGFVLYFPVYKHSDLVRNTDNYEASLLGFVASVFYFEDMIHAILPNLDSKKIAFEIYDQSNINEPQLLFSNQQELNITSPNSNLGQLTYQQELEIFDRQWRVSFTALSVNEYRSWATWMVLSGGLFFTAMFTGFLLILSGRTSYIKQVVNDKTKDLEQINYLMNRANQALVSTNKKLLDSEFQFRKLVQTQSAIVWRYDLISECMTFVSNEAEKLLGYPNEYWFEKGFWLNHIYEDDREQALFHALKAVKNQQKYYFEYRMIAKSGQLVWVKDIVNVVIENGRATELVGVMIDISSEKKAEQQTRLAATTFETLEGITITDANAVVLKVNKAFSNITGYSEEESVGKHMSFLKSGHQDTAFYTDMWQQLIDTGKFEGEIWNRRKNGEIFPEWITITAVKDNNDVVTNYVGIFSDITAKKASEDEIRNLAFYDSLTNLPNRRLLLDRLQHEIIDAKRHHHFGAIVFLDLDCFKILNDSLGHHIGDELLIQVAKRLKSVLRDEDTACRLGGDEFVILLPAQGKSAEEAADKSINVAEKVRVLINKPYILQDNEQTFSTSIGVTIFPTDSEKASYILQQADTAMYLSKDSGKNRISFYHASMQEAADKRLLLENELRLAIKTQQFVLFYQPQVDESGHVMSAEALIRWLHPEKGYISPADFIPVAEETSLILPIGDWVLNEVCRQIKEWQSSEFTLGHIAINVSARQFKQHNFVDLVCRAITENNISADKLILELTESIVADDINDTIQKMNALKERGIKISIDDFGTGYSSLSYLKQLPIDQLKIDQSFVRDIGVDVENEVIVETIINMANSLKLNVIAEGVETEEQALFLKEKGCNTFQGYYFGRPMPDDEFILKIDMGKLKHN